MKYRIWGAFALAGIVCLSAPAQAQSDGGTHASLSRDETSWYVRAALNVAALGCRDAAEAQTIASYNKLLARHRAPLAAADAGVKAQYRSRFGSGWETRHDREMTRVYNFYAQPTAHDGLCAEARAVLAEAETVAPAEFADFAAYALARLDTPFTSGSLANGYRLGESAWRGRVPQR